MAHLEPFSITASVYLLNIFIKKKKRDLSRIQCFGCDKFGHFDRDCNSRLKHQVAITDVENVSLPRESSENSER